MHRELTCLQEVEMAVYGYARVSTDRQAGEGESLGTQQRVRSFREIQGGRRRSRAFTFAMLPLSTRLRRDQKQAADRDHTDQKPQTLPCLTDPHSAPAGKLAPGKV